MPEVVHVVKLTRQAVLYSGSSKFSVLELHGEPGSVFSWIPSSPWQKSSFYTTLSLIHPNQQALNLMFPVQSIVSWENIWPTLSTIFSKSSAACTSVLCTFHSNSSWHCCPVLGPSNNRVQTAAYVLSHLTAHAIAFLHFIGKAGRGGTKGLSYCSVRPVSQNWN